MTFDGRLFAGITVLVAVAESGSFVRAAEALGVSPSGVSRAISRLEKQIGVRLLDRTTRSQTLTDEGRRLYETVSPHLVGIECAASTASGSAGVVQGKLRVNVDPFFSRTVLASKLPALLQQFPELSVELIMRDDVGDLVADGFDLAIRFGPPPVGTLVARKLLEARIITVASPAYLESNGRPSCPDDVVDHERILFYNPLSGRPFEWEFHRGKEVVGIPVYGRLLVSDVGTMLNACVAGAGIAQVMSIGTETLIAQQDLVDLFPDWPDERFPLYALYPSRRHLAAKVQAFISFCVDTQIAPNGSATSQQAKRSRSGLKRSQSRSR
ncbi:LysR family transcriptional regulator [Paraburkholderia sp. CNPSo 3155]|uniref:LysR family transcriptional regulator n=1 Tax=Paraburkholderia atlantica TaxID=2654982 RepID=UPI00128D921E|nr:LysR family transcriptional regulator [Paraburkholderia atlantica]MPW04992.1 LysR family transcriptional regulator [Paraburkholderia atlantica]